MLINIQLIVTVCCLFFCPYQNYKNCLYLSLFTSLEYGAEMNTYGEGVNRFDWW